MVLQESIKITIYQVILIFGIAGACRCDEIFEMKLDAIEDFGSMLLVKIPDIKTGKSRTFAVGSEVNINKYTKYVSQRPAEFKECRFFIK